MADGHLCGAMFKTAAVLHKSVPLSMAELWIGPVNLLRVTHCGIIMQ